MRHTDILNVCILANFQVFSNQIPAPLKPAPRRPSGTSAQASACPSGQNAETKFSSSLIEKRKWAHAMPTGRQAKSKKWKKILLRRSPASGGARRRCVAVRFQKSLLK